MFRKTLVATLIVASAAFALVNKASAAPNKPSHEISWLERASTNYDGGGY